MKVKSKPEYSIALQVKSIREFLGMTQVELARKAQVTPAAISQIEAGTREPSIGTAIALANVFGCTVDRLIRGPHK